MASLLNTTWTFVAPNHDFVTFTVNFQPKGVATVNWNNGVSAIGTWKEGKRFFSFTLSVIYPGDGSENNAVGTHQSGNGSGTIIFEYTGGAYKAPFSMTKNK